MRCRSSFTTSNGPVNGQCVPPNHMYYKTQAVYTTVQEEYVDASLFGSTFCRSLLRTGTVSGCGECRPSMWIDPQTSSRACSFCPVLGCYSCEGNTCTGGCGDKLYYNSTSNTCDHCFYSCKKCGGSDYDQCLTCRDGFYWRSNNFGNFGSCAPCHSQCKTCYGPGLNQCVELHTDHYWINLGLDTQTTVACDPSCGGCDGSPTTCTQCRDEYISAPDEVTLFKANNTCQLTDNFMIMPDCQEITDHGNGTLECARCGLFTVWDPFHVDGPSCQNPGTVTCNYTAETKDSRDFDCLGCGTNPTVVMNYDSKTCHYVGTESTGCSQGAMFSGKYYCLKCNSGYSLNLQTGRCVTTCPIGLIFVTWGGITMCMKPTPGCLQGTFDANFDFTCTLCDTPSFAKYQSTDKSCLNMVCNTQYLGINKQCSPVLSPTTCDPNLCFNNDIPGECTGGICKRKIFELIFNETSLVLKINKNYDFFLRFDVKNFSTYEKISDTEKKVFCSLFSDELDDGFSLCKFKNGSLKIEVTPTKYRQIVAQGFLTLKKKAFKIYRKMLSMEADDLNDPASTINFDWELSAPLNMESKRGLNWVVNFQKVMSFNTGIIASVNEKTTRFGYNTYSWECVFIEGDSDDSQRSALNNTLQTFSNNSLNVTMTNTLLINKQIKIKLSIVDEYAQIHIIYLNFSLASGDIAFSQPKTNAVYFVDGEGVYVPLVSSLQQVNVGDVLVTADGLNGTFSYNLDKRANHYVLYVKVTNGSDFTLNITYGTYLPTQLTFIRKRANYPSMIIHENAADPIMPFRFQLLARKSTFKVYCVDEDVRAQCLVSPELRTYTPGDDITLQDVLNFTTDGTKTLFFRIIGPGDETITATKVQGKAMLQATTPEITTRSGVIYPEAPFHTDTDSFYIDTKIFEVTNVNGLPGEYRDPLTVAQPITVDYVADENKRQILQVTPVSAFRMLSQVQFLLNGGAPHSIVESRFITRGSSSSLSISSSSSTSGISVELVSDFKSGDLCNDASGQLNYVYSFDENFYISDLGSYSKKTLMPITLAGNSTTIRSKVYSNCGPIESAPVSWKDNSNMTFNSTLATYVNYQLLNFGTTYREQVGSLNLLALQLSRAFNACNRTNQCVATQAEIINQTEVVFNKLPEIIEDNKYSMLSRYSFLNGFLSSPGQITDNITLQLLQKLESTNQYIADKIDPYLEANNRFSLDLRLGVSNLNLVLGDMTDYPVRTSSNLLNYMLFSYSNDTDRNNQTNKTISQIVRSYELKLIRTSSHKKKEFYEDSNIKVQGVTILSPLASEYQFQLDNSTILLFKDLKFENVSAYYEMIVIRWADDLLNRMKPVYNQTTNDFAKRNFYVDFMSYFQRNIPIEGEVQVYSSNCTTPSTGNCTAVPMENYTFCQCEQASAIAGTPPTATKLPPVNETKPEPTCQLCSDVTAVLTKRDFKELDPEKFSNFEVFCYSTLLIQLGFTAVYTLALLFKSKLEALSMGFCNGVGLTILIHKLCMQQQAKSNDPFENVSINESMASNRSSKSVKSSKSGSSKAKNDKKEKEVKDNKNDDEDKNDKKDKDDKNNKSSSSSKSDKSDNSSDSPKSSARSGDPLTDSTKQNVQRDLNKISQENPDQQQELSKVKPDDIKPLGFFQLYQIYLKLNHTVASVAFLNSTRYTKFTIITLTYIRIIAHLAVSMYFTLGIGNEDYSDSQRWILKCAIAPAPLLITFTLLRKLLSGEITNAVTPTAQNAKLKTAESSPIKSSQVSPTHSKLLSQGSLNSNDNTSKVTTRTISLDDLQIKSYGGAADNLPSVPSTPSTSRLTTIKNWAGRVLLICVAAGSIYVILAISTGGDSKESWPWGFWYVFSLCFDQVIFQPLTTLCQFFLVYKYLVGNPGEKFKSFVRFVIGTDIMGVFDNKAKFLKK